MITHQLEDGTIPGELKETITVALRKPGKKDYTLIKAYMPIALENTIVKTVETTVTRTLASAAENIISSPGRRWKDGGGDPP